MVRNGTNDFGVVLGWIHFIASDDFFIIVLYWGLLDVCVFLRGHVDRT